MLEDDGTQCFDLEMVQSEVQDDLRMSIGAAGMDKLSAPEEMKLIAQLEKSKEEYESLKRLKE